VRRGMLFPVIREGMIGRSRKADIRLRCNAVRNRHAYFEMTANGLLVRAAGSARIQGNAGRMRAMMLTDGSVITIGRLRLMLILTDATAAPSVAPVRVAEAVPEEEEADIFEAVETFTTSSGGIIHGSDNAFTHVMDDRAADAALYEEQDPFERKPRQQNKEEEWWPNA